MTNQQKIEDLMKRVAELEEDDTNAHAAYTMMRSIRDRLWNENQALKAYIAKGGLPIPDAEHLELSTLREKVYQYEQAIEYITTREVECVNGYDPLDSLEKNIANYLMRVTALFRADGPK